MAEAAGKAAIMRDFTSSFQVNDFEKAISLCSDDVTWETSMGKFNGKEGLKRYFDWVAENVKDYKITETGLGILEQDDRAFYEHTISGIMQGEKVEFLAMCTYEFSGDKIKNLRTVFDRLSIAEQASSNQFIPKKLVNTIINQMQKGLT